MIQLVREQVHGCGVKHAPRLYPAEHGLVEAPLVLADLILSGQQVRYYVAFSREVKGSDHDAVAKREHQELASEVVHLFRVSSALFIDVCDRGADVDQEAQRLAFPPLEVVVKY